MSQMSQANQLACISESVHDFEEDSTVSSKLTVRVATPHDLNEIMAIEIDSFSSPWPREAFTSEIEEQELSRVVLACHASKIVGFMVYWVVEDELHLSNLAVEKGWRKRGVGRCLVDYLIDDGKKNSKKVVFLEVRVTNRVAINLYKSFGFKELDLRRGYYADNGEDALVMYLMLNESV